jgi:hypothetical protein
MSKLERPSETSTSVLQTPAVVVVAVWPPDVAVEVLDVLLVLLTSTD